MNERKEEHTILTNETRSGIDISCAAHFLQQALPHLTMAQNINSHPVMHGRLQLKQTHPRQKYGRDSVENFLVQRRQCFDSSSSRDV